MPWEEWINALLGGVMIGGGSLLLLLANGRIFGVSGILSGALWQRGSERTWRLAVLLGLLVGGFILGTLRYPAFDLRSMHSLPVVAVAGVLVGFGTRMGNGCTSGHGVCGISRFSLRSLVATCVFIASGVLTVAAVRFCAEHL